MLCWRRSSSIACLGGGSLSAFCSCPDTQCSSFCRKDASESIVLSFSSPLYLRENTTIRHEATQSLGNHYSTSSVLKLNSLSHLGTDQKVRVVDNHDKEVSSCQCSWCHLLWVLVRGGNNSCHLCGGRWLSKTWGQLGRFASRHHCDSFVFTPWKEKHWNMKYCGFLKKIDFVFNKWLQYFIVILVNEKIRCCIPLRLVHWHKCACKTTTSLNYLQKQEMSNNLYQLSEFGLFDRTLRFGYSRYSNMISLGLFVAVHWRMNWFIKSFKHCAWRSMLFPPLVSYDKQSYSRLF